MLPMTHVTIDTKTKQGKKLVELIETLSYAKVHKGPNAITRKAIEDARKSKTRRHKNAKELIAFLNK
jgi:ribosomal protein L16/L10AE